MLVGRTLGHVIYAMFVESSERCVSGAPTKCTETWLRLEPVVSAVAAENNMPHAQCATTIYRPTGS